MGAPPVILLTSIVPFFLVSSTANVVPFIVLHEELVMGHELLGLHPLRIKQVEVAEVCDKVKQMEQLSQEYSIVGLSQGNAIGRGVVEFCDGGPSVKNFISLGGPHVGTALVPLCGSGIFYIIVDTLIKSSIQWTTYRLIWLLVYLKIPTNMDAYLEKGSILPRLNNELPDQRNSTYKERFSSLENLLLIMFEHDTDLIPKETSWFGYFSDGTFGFVLPLQQTNLYIEDWIGLKALDDAGTVKYVSVPGNHLEISHKNIKEYVVPYLESQAPSPRSSLESMQPDQKKETVQHHLKRRAHSMTSYFEPSLITNSLRKLSA